jgi:hypothetical protein
MHAIDELQALLTALGRDHPEDEVLVLSGAAFRWYYADSEDYDPRTARCEVDVVARGLAAFGVHGQPGGGGSGDTPVAAFLVEGVCEEMSPPERLSAAFAAAAILSRPGSFEPSGGGPIPRGPDAYEALIEDLLLGREIAEGGRPGRLAAALAGLARDRHAAAAVLERVAADPETYDLDTDRADRLERAAATFARAAELATDLCGRAFRPHAGDPEAVDAIVSRVEAETALLVGIGDVEPAVRDALAAEGLTVVETRLGTAVVADDPERRGMAARLAATIRDLDAEAFGLLA